MCRVLLATLLLMSHSSESTCTPSESSAGLKFIVAFPENIAHFYPKHAENKIKITALYNNTEVYIKGSQTILGTLRLNAGDTREFEAEPILELPRSEESDKILQITSNKKITVHVINLKEHSLQTALAISSEKLGRKYTIPPVPLINGTTQPADQVTTNITERGPFRLVILNTEQLNMVTLTGTESKVIPLQPHHVAQIWLREEEAWRVVSATQPVAVLFGHTCAIRHNCTCGQLYTVLPADHEEEQKFYIPPFLAEGAENETFLLITEREFAHMRIFNSSTPLLETTGTAILYRPGLLLALIPDTDFFACSVINSIPEAMNLAIIVVHKDQTVGLHLGPNPLNGSEWQPLARTDYVSTQVVLTSEKTVIWHSSSKMAVYFMGIKNGMMFGNPTPIISRTPDYRGCVLSPEVLKIGEVAGSWRESVKYCEDNHLDMVSFPNNQLQNHIYDKVTRDNNGSLQEVWIGLRRSSQTGEWYWLSQEPFGDSNWAQGEPGTVNDGQCAILSLENHFGWSDKDCCDDAHPVCYKNPDFFPT